MRTARRRRRPSGHRRGGAKNTTKLQDHINEFSKRAKPNIKYAKDLLEDAEEVMDATQQQANEHEQARLRQVLSLLTGGLCDSDLFVDASGKLRPPKNVHAAVQDLMQSYRLENGPLWAAMRTAYRFVEKTTMYGYVMVQLALVAAGIYGLHKSNTWLDNKIAPYNVSEDTRLSLKGVGLSAIGYSLWSARINPLRPLFKSIDTLFKYRTIQVIDEVFTDGISDKKKDHMRQVARYFDKLQARVDKVMHCAPDRRKAKLHEMLDEFEKRCRGFFGMNKRTKDIIALLRDGIDQPDTIPVDEMRARLMQLYGGKEGKGVQFYHLFDNAGNPRSVQEIVAAYLVMHDVLKTIVAVKKSVRSAKQKAVKGRGGRSTHRTRRR